MDNQSYFFKLADIEVYGSWKCMSHVGEAGGATDRRELPEAFEEAGGG